MTKRSKKHIYIYIYTYKKAHKQSKTHATYTTHTRVDTLTRALLYHVANANVICMH